MPENAKFAGIETQPPIFISLNNLDHELWNVEFEALGVTQKQIDSLHHEMGGRPPLKNEPYYPTYERKLLLKIVTMLTVLNQPNSQEHEILIKDKLKVCVRLLKKHYGYSGDTIKQMLKNELEKTK